MNTMVGMQASLHTSVGAGMDLAKNEGADDSNDVIPLDSEGAEVFGEDFDPSELLNSPLFNDSTNKFQSSEKMSFAKANLQDSSKNNLDDSMDSFGDFAEDLGPDPSMQSDADFNDDDFEPIKSAMPDFKPSSPKRTVSGPPSFSVTYQSPIKQPQQPMSLAQAQLFQTEQPFLQPLQYQSFQQPPQFQQQQQIQQQQQLPPVPQQVQFQQPPPQQAPQQTLEVIQQQFPSTNQQLQLNFSMMPQSSGFPPPHCSPSRRGMNSPAFRRTPQRAVSYTEGQGPSINGQMMGGNFQLRQMQQQLEHMRNGNGLSQSMHAPLTQGNVLTSVRSPGMVSLDNSVHGVESLNGSMHGPDNCQTLMTQSMHGVAGAPPFAAFPPQVNLALGSDMPSCPPGMPNMQVMGQQQNPATLNDAMEKLCESMKRSAMTRNLVKQISTRSASGNLSNSSRSLMNNSNRPMAGSSSRNLKTLMDDGSGRGAPAAPLRRLSNSKHTLSHHGRGVYRHNSQQSLDGSSNHGMTLNIDGRTVGKL